MRRWTRGEIKDKVMRDLDLEAEDFITDTELNDIVNEGVDDCEALIHGLGRESEYFLAKAQINTVLGQDTYDLPSDIFATKILSIAYVNGSTIYPVKRLRAKDRFVDLEVINSFGTSNDYRYLVIHDTVTDGYKINLFPASRESLTPGLKLWYIRNANRLEADSDICDIPEFVYYVIAFVKYQVLSKEGHPNTAEAKLELERQKEAMLSTLKEMVPDGDDELLSDFSHYENST